MQLQMEGARTKTQAKAKTWTIMEGIMVVAVSLVTQRPRAAALALGQLDDGAPRAPRGLPARVA